VKEFDVHHQKYIDEWHKYEQNVVRIFHMRTGTTYKTYLEWYQRAMRIKLR
jgi:AraC-like DNA-binding protein